MVNFCLHPRGPALPDSQGLRLGTDEHQSQRPRRRSLDISGHQWISSSSIISTFLLWRSYQHRAWHIKLRRGKQAWEEQLRQEKCCTVNYSVNKSRKKVGQDSLPYKLVFWQLGKDICSAQASAVCLYDHTFLMSILKHFLSRTNLTSRQSPLAALGTERLNSSEEPLSWGWSG